MDGFVIYTQMIRLSQTDRCLTYKCGLIWVSDSGVPLFQHPTENKVSYL